jgi:hypothetical protein
MSRALNAPLSPREENALRRVAHGLVLAVELPSNDRNRLEILGLVKISSDVMKLTTKGKRRYELLPHRVSR